MDSNKTSEIERLQKENKLLREIIDLVPFGIQVFDSEGFSALMNEAQKKILGIKDKETGVGEFNVLTDPYSEENGAAEIYKKAYEGKTQNHTKEYNLDIEVNRWETRKDKRLLSESIIPINDETGRPEYVAAIIEDITERKRQSKELRRSDELFKAIFRQDQSVKLIINPETGQIEDCNPAAARFYGYPEPELKTKNIHNINVLTPIEIKDEMNKALIEKKSFFDFKHRISGGIIKDVAVYSSPVNIDGKKRLLSIIHDVTQEKHAQLQLQLSEKRHRDFVNHSPDIIYQYSNVRGAIFWSDRVFDILGYRPEELKVNPHIWNSSIHPDDRPLVENAVESFTGKKPVTVEYRIKTKDHRWIWLSDYFMYKVEDDNEAIIEGHASDITERKILEIEVMDAKARFDKVIEATNDGIWDWNLLTGDVYFSPRWKAMLGYRDDELGNSNAVWNEMIHPNDEKRFGKLLQEHIERKRNRFETEIKMKHKDGRYIDILCRGNAFFNPTGTPYRVVGTNVDITERKKSENIIKASRAKFKKVFDIVDVGLAITDSKGVFLECNSAFASISGLSKLALINGSLTEADIAIYTADMKEIPPSDLPSITAMNEKRTIEDVEAVIKQGDEILNISITASPLSLKGYGVLSAYADITESKNREVKLADLNATKDKLFSIIAHDLRSPYSAILGFAKLAEKNIALKNYEKVERYCELVRNASEQTFELLSNLLEWARLQRGQIRLKRELLDIGKLLEVQLGVLSISADTKKIRLETDIEKDLKIPADAFMLNTIFRNLISNAVKFSEPDSDIIISGRISEANEAEFEVRDTGVGIAEADIDKLFKLESNFSTEGTNMEKGSGLGLIICKEFVDKHHGIIEAESRLGEGTTIRFTIPINQEHSAD